MADEHSRYENFIAELRQRLEAEYQESPALQAEFVTAEDYIAWSLREAERLGGVLTAWRENFKAAECDAAFRRAAAAGRVRILGQ